MKPFNRYYSPLLLIHDLNHPGTYRDNSGRTYTPEDVAKMAVQVVIIQLPADVVLTIPENNIQPYKTK